MNIKVSKCNSIPVNRPSDFRIEDGVGLRRTNSHDYPQPRGFIVQTEVTPMVRTSGAIFALGVDFYIRRKNDNT